MGFNTWYAFRTSISEQLVLAPLPHLDRLARTQDDFFVTLDGAVEQLAVRLVRSNDLLRVDVPDERGPLIDVNGSRCRS